MRLGFLSPRLMTHVKYGTMCNLNVFPRRVRNTTPEGTDPIILQSYLSICTARTRRLLASPDELRREVGDLMELKYSTLSYSMDVPPFEKRREGECQHSLDRARSVPVVENDLTTEFLSARSNPHWTGYSNGYGRWEYYKTLQRKRHRMGEYCRSNLDWDWATSGSLKRLFKIDRTKKTPQPGGAKQNDVSVTDLPVSIELTDPGGGIDSDNLTLDVTIPETELNASVLGKVRIRFETKSGEVRYKTFYAGTLSEDEDVAPDAGAGAGAGLGTWLSSGKEIGHGE